MYGKYVGYEAAVDDRRRQREEVPVSERHALRAPQIHKNIKSSQLCEDRGHLLGGRDVHVLSRVRLQRLARSGRVPARESCGIVADFNDFVIL